MEKLFKIILLLAFTLGCASAFKIRTQEEIENREHMLKHADAFAELFISEFANFTRTGIRTSSFDGMLKLMQIPKEFVTLEIDEMESEPAIMTCLACRSTFALMINQYRTGQRTVEQLIQDSIGLCQQLTPFSIIVCEGAVRKHAVSILSYYVVQKTF